MITYSIIQKSQLEGAKRLDAEYYQLEYLNVRGKITSLENISLGTISSKFKKGIFDIKADTYTEDGVPFVRISNLKDGLIGGQEIAFISEETDLKEKETSLIRNDIVLSKTAYPAASLVTFDRVNISQDIIGISIKKEWQEKLLSKYIVVFLNSKFGMLEMQQWFQGNIQMHLALPDAKTILIPILPLDLQEKIVELFSESYSQLEDSKKLFQQAEDLLLGELGLKDFKVEEDLSFVVNLSDVKSAKRLDSDYFQPKYETLVSQFRKIAKPLKNIVSRTTKLVKINPEEEYKYIEISDINVGDGGIIANIILGNGLPTNAKMNIRGGELLISKVRPTRGAVSIVPDSWSNNYVASGAFSIFNADSPTREFLQVVMRSIVGRLQLEKPTTGTSYPTVTDQDVENILIPILSRSSQQKISELVRKSHEARKKSKELLEEAKRKVEEMIEKGGEIE